MSPSNPDKQEIIIVRRSHGDHGDDHHGGVWKIAFADFMTAMMAFFLVMWLINASNEETKKAVASYFNPIKLTDTTTNPKGIRSPKYTDPEVESTSPEISTHISKKLNSSGRSELETKAFEEVTLFLDPYALLMEIERTVEGDAATKTASEAQETGVSDGLGYTEGTRFHDPFDPSAWNVELGQPGKSVSRSGNDRGQSLQDAPDARDDKDNMEKDSKYRDAADETTPASDAELSVQKSEYEKLSEELVKATQTDLGNSIELEVRKTDEGFEIVLLDRDETGMFDIGSARPRPALVKTLKAIGGVLQRREGKIAIAGHTDGRQYFSGAYDNWRLSTSRAHMAYFMLTRGGVKEQRFSKIEGHADTQLATASDPLAPENRRIEIMVVEQ